MFFNKLSWVIKIRCASLPKAVFGPSFSSTKSWEPGYYIFGKEHRWVYPTFEVILMLFMSLSVTQLFFVKTSMDPAELCLQSVTLKCHLAVLRHLLSFSEKPFLGRVWYLDSFRLYKLSDRLAYFNWSTKDWWPSIEQCLHLDSA